MTLDQWLQEAAGIFPLGVRERLRQEYTAHLEDSVAAGGSGDVLELFGEPGQTTESLHKLYIRSTTLAKIKEQNRWIFWATSVATAGLFVLSMTSGSTLFQIILCGLALITHIVIWNSSKSWIPEYRTKIRNDTGSLASVLPMISNLFRGNTLSFPITGAFFFIFLVFGIYSTFEAEKRLRRTLELEEVSFDRGRIKLHPDR